MNAVITRCIMWALLLLTQAGMLRGQSPAVVTRDIEALERYYTDGEVDLEAAFYVLADYAAGRYVEDEPTAELSEIYHQLALAYSNWAPDLSLIYLDTTRELRFMAPGVTLTQKARTVYLQGEKYVDLEAYGQAAKFLEEAVSLLERALIEEPEETKNHTRFNYFHYTAGMAAYSNGDLALAKFHFEKAADNLKRYPNETDRIATTGGMANVLFDLGKIDSSLSITQALVDEIEASGRREAGVYLMNLGIDYSKAGDRDNAEKYFQRALAAHLKDLAEDDQMRTEHFIIDLYSNWLEHDLRNGNSSRLATTLRAVDRYRPDQTIYANGGPLGEVYLRLATGYARLGDFAKADSLLGLSKNALLRLGLDDSSTPLPVVTGAVIASRPDDVFELLDAYRERYLWAYGVTEELADLELAQLASRKIDTLIRSGRQQLSFTASLRPFIQRERAYYAGAIDLALRAYEITGDRQDLWEAYRFAAGPKASLLKRFLGAQALSLSFGVSQNMIDRKAALEVRQLVLERELAASGDQPDPAVRDSALAVNRRNTALRDELFLQYPELQSALREGIDFSEADLRAALDEDLMLIEYFLADSVIHIFTVSKALGLRHAQIDRPQGLDGWVAAQLTDVAASRQLFDRLVAPALTGLPEKITRLQFIPDTDLWTISFAALTKSGGSVLVEDYAVSYAYSVSMIMDGGNQDALAEREQTYLGFGISYESILSNLNTTESRSVRDRDLRNMGALPYARDEVAQSALLYGGNALLDEEATKASFLSLAGQASILHLAMHGLLEENPLETSLVFAAEGSQGYAPLTMREILTRRFANKLTVLSACHTGGGPIESSEGMQSIGRAFTAAGSKATITSNWEANDRATHDILLAFYAELGGGQPKDVALQRAVKQYLAGATAAERQPERWANLVINGSLSPVVNSGISTFIWAGLGLLSILLIALLIWWVTTKR